MAEDTTKIKDLFLGCYSKLPCSRPESLRPMAPTTSPLREDTRLRVMSSMQRQLAPTVGPAASGGRNRVGSAFAGISDTVAVGRVQYYGRFPSVPPDECWIPARTNVVRLSIIPIGVIHIFIGETVDHDGTPLVSSPEPTADELVAAEHELNKLLYQL